MVPTRAGLESKNRSSRLAAPPRTDASPVLTTSMSGVPPIHCVTRTPSVTATTSGMTKSSSSAKAPRTLLHVGLVLVVELLAKTVAELFEQGAGIELRRAETDERRDTVEMSQVRGQCFGDARVLELHRDIRSVMPHGAVHLPDAGRGDRSVVEVIEAVAPIRPE